MSRNKRPGPETEIHIAERERALREAGAARSPSHHADLERLFAAHRDRIRALCLRMTGDPARADELVQESLLVAYSRLPEFHGGARFGTWIYGIARNLCLNAIRKKTDFLSEDGVIEAADPSGGVWKGLRREERAALLRDAAATLAPDEQDAAHLRYVEGLGLERIDAILGLTGSGARAVLQRARRKLRAEVLTRLEEAGHGRSFLDST